MNENDSKPSIPMTNTTWIDESGETLEVSYLTGTPYGEPRIYIEMTRAASKPGEICDFIDVAMTRRQILELITTLQEALKETEATALLRALNATGEYDIPTNAAELYFEVPSGGDYSGMPIDIDSENPIVVSWETHEQRED